MREDYLRRECINLFHRKSRGGKQIPTCSPLPAWGFLVAASEGQDPQIWEAIGAVAAPDGSERAGREGKRQPGWLWCLLCTGDDDAVVSFSR